MSLVYSGAEPQPSLAWTFEGSASDYITNVSPSSANVNGVYQSTTTWPYYDSVSPKYGTQSIYLLNSNAPTQISNCIFYNQGTGINIPFGGSNTSTISFWYKFLTAPGGTGDNTLVFLTYNQGNKTSYIFAKNPATTLGSYGNFSGTAAGIPNSGSSQVTVGTWYHVAQTTTNTTQTLYVNGSLVGSRTYTAINGDSSNVWNSMALGTYFFGTNPSAGASCELDDLRIYNTALTAAQVQSVYSSQGAPAPSRAMPLPKLAWDFNGTTTDYVSGLTGTTTGSISYNSSGKYGQSLVITNTTGLVASNYVSYSTPYYPSTLTTAVWLKLNTIDIGNQYFLQFGGTSGGIAYVIAIAGNNTVNFRVQALGGVATTIVTTSTLNSGQWYHIAAVIDGYNQTIYLNGVIAAGPSPCNTLDFQYQNITLGGSTTNAGRVLVNGELDDLRIFDRALTSSQVQAIYNQQGVPGRGAVVSNSRQIYVAPVGTYPSYTPTSGAQFPVFNTSNVSFYSSGGTSGGTVGQYLAFGSQTFNMSSGFSAVCQFAWTNGIGVWERILDFGIGTNNNNILLTRTGTSMNLLFSYRIGGTEYYVTAVGSIPAQNTLYTVVAIYDPSKPLLSLYVNGTLTSSIPAVVALDTRTLTQTYVGRSNWGSDAYSNVNINYLSIYNRVLTPDEIATPLPTPQITLKGTPLFNQLSQDARSSAVGAFSLRAVNGVTARAVQVRPQAQFPPVAMSSAAVQATNQFTQTLTGYPFGGAGSYTANCSSFFSGLPPWKAFDMQIGPNKWASGAGEDYSAGVATTNTQTSGIYNGAWLQIQLPISINLFSYSITAAPNLNKMPSKWYILGSNDGSSWTLVDSQQTGVSWSGGEIKTSTPSPTIAYLYYRMVINQINDSTAGGNLAEIGEWTLYGAPPNTNTDFYADRLGNLLTAPVVGTSLQNWLGGATGYVTKWYDQSGKGNDASQNTAANQPIIQRATKGPGYSTLWPGLTSTRLIYGTSSNIFDSTNYSICVNAKRTVAVSTTTYYAGTNGQPVTNQNLGVGYANDTTLRLSEYGYSLNAPTVSAYAGVSEPLGYDFFTFSQTSGMRNYTWRSGTSASNINTGLTTPLTRSGNSTIGGTNDSASFIGEIYELLVFTQSLYDLDTSGGIITQIYQNQLGAYGT